MILLIISFVIALFIAYIQNQYDDDDDNQIAEEIIARQNEYIEGETAEIVKSSRAINIPTIYYIIAGVLLIFAICIALDIMTVSDSNAEKVRVHNYRSGGTVLMDSGLFLFMQIIIFTSLFCFLFYFIKKYFIKNKVPDALILTPTKLIIFNYSGTINGLSKHSKLIKTEWDKVQCINTKYYDYFIISYLNDEGMLCENPILYTAISISKEELKSLFEKYGIKVIK